MSKRVDGKVIVVTGAGSIADGIGNGKAAALLYAREGGRLILVDRNPDAVAVTRGLIEEEGGTSIAITADVSNAEDCQRVVATSIDRFGRIDVLHNNVGIERPGGLVDTSHEDWDLTMNVNLKSIYLLCRSTVPHMVHQGGGSIISISSINAIRTLPALSLAYSVSKAGVIALMREIAIEYAGAAIRANSVLPGMMRTPFVTESLTQAYGGDVSEMMRARDALCPTGSQGESWDVAHMSLFLASDDSKYVTGAAFVVDGGQSAQMAATPMVWG